MICATTGTTSTSRWASIDDDPGKGWTAHPRRQGARHARGARARDGDGEGRHGPRRGSPGGAGDDALGSYHALEPFKVPIQTLPNLRDFFNGRVTVSQIRRLSVRGPPRASAGRARRRTGPRPRGGQARADHRRRRLDRLGAFSSDRRPRAPRRSSCSTATRTACTLDDRTRAGASSTIRSGWSSAMRPTSDQTTALLAAHRPDIVFHAAAHKHVPTDGGERGEAVKNNRPRNAASWWLSQRSVSGSSGSS